MRITCEEPVYGNVVVRKYDESEPRDDHGRWTADGSSGPASRLTPEQVRTTGATIRRNTAAFGEAGGRIVADASPLVREGGRDSWLRMSQAGVFDQTQDGPYFTRLALRDAEAGDEFANVAFGPGDEVAGAHSFGLSDDAHDLSLTGGDEVAGRGVIGTTGIMPGVGSALVAEYVRQSADAGRGIVVVPVVGAEDFWAKMGMRSLEGRTWGMTATDVKALAAELDVRKYAEGQPRDDHGRFTTDGSSGGAVRVDLGDHVSYRQPDGTLTRWPDLTTAIDEYGAAHPFTNLYNLQAGKPIETMAALDQLDKLQSQFPSVRVSVGLERPSVTDVPHAYAWCDRKPEGGSHIYLNPTYWREGTPETLYKPSAGYHPAGSDSPSGIMTHEFGHAVDSYLKSGWDAKTEGWDALSYDQKVARNGIFAAQGFASDVQSSHLASGYGKTNTGENFAEWFSASYTNPTPAENTAPFREAMDRVEPLLRTPISESLPALIDRVDAEAAAGKGWSVSVG